MLRLMSAYSGCYCPQCDGPLSGWDVRKTRTPTGVLKRPVKCPNCGAKVALSGGGARSLFISWALVPLLFIGVLLGLMQVLSPFSREYWALTLLGSAGLSMIVVDMLVIRLQGVEVIEDGSDDFD